MIEVFHAVILGIVQGVTEFLPISSSGHLILLPRLFGWQDQGLAVDAVLHLATALAIIAFFRRDWWLLLKNWRTSNSLRKILIASIPAALVGLVFGDLIESIFRSPWVVVVMLVLVAVIMWWVERYHYAVVSLVESSKKQEVVPLDWPEVLIMGVVQTLAFIPGTSRSGITITAGMFRNVNRVTAAKFSFLLGVPVTLGAGLTKVPDLLTGSTDWIFVVMAGFTTFVVALITMRWLLGFLQTHSLLSFIVYRVVLALIVGIVLLV